MEAQGIFFYKYHGIGRWHDGLFSYLFYVRFELSYDSFHSKADRIYRVVADIKTPTEVT